MRKKRKPHAKLSKHNLSSFPLYYEANKKLDISQAIFVSNHVVARLARRISHHIRRLTATRTNSKSK